MNDWSRTLADILIFGFFVYLVATGYLQQFLQILGLTSSASTSSSEAGT